MASRVITVTDPSVVTNDTLDSYNNYSDVDGLLGSMTPAEAAAGKTVTLNDGNVHQVTTKPVGTANGEFSAVISNAVEVDLGSAYLLEDDFTGTTIDTNKWNVTNPSSSIFITQNNELDVYADHTESVSSYTDYIYSNLSFNMATTKCLSFDLKVDNQNELYWGFGFVINNDNRIQIQRSTTNGDIYVQARESAVNIIPATGYTLDVSTYQRFKLLATATDTSIYHWTGASWNQIATSPHSWSTNLTVGATTANQASGSAPTRMNIDNLFVTDYDYATQTP